MPDKHFRTDEALAPLKAFQRRTVDYVFDRFYGSDDSVRQFLVADEVGLGKTMVARGVIARTIEHLWESTKRIDIIYICSNQAIAAQNLNRLNVLECDELALPTRMTLIPLQMRSEAGLETNKVNFISLTPRTTFSLRSFTGVVKERALLYHLLCDTVSRPRGLLNLLQVQAGKVSWDRAVDELSLDGVDTRLIERFRSDIRKNRGLSDELERVCEMFRRRRKSYPDQMVKSRKALVSGLREALSRACVDALEPDLIILDEFQRFRDLLDGDNEAATLARELFDYSEGPGHAARTLLLSATPYKMVTLAGDKAEDGEHYKNFLETLKFLYGEKGQEVADTLANEMHAFRMLLHGLPRSHAEAVEARKTIENRLRKVISRTERVASTVKRDSMMGEPAVPVSLAATDLAQAAAVSNVAGALDKPQVARNIIEYWKSAPYLLNFMRDYRLKVLLHKEKEKKAPSGELRDAIQAARPAMLNRRDLNEYAPLEPANGRMRAIMDDVFGAGLERNLWIPAAMPYYGPERSGPPLSKALVFSAWTMVPDAIAALLTYEAERRRGTGAGGRGYFQQRWPRPLHFRRDQGRLAGLRTLLLVYPSPALAEIADPLDVFASQDQILSESAMRKAVAGRLEPALEALRRASIPDQGTAIAEWAAPAVIDELLGRQTVDWLEDMDEYLPASDGEDGFRDHVAELAKVAAACEFGGIPAELADLLVDVALGSPAVCALRALRRIAPELAWDDPHLLGAAVEIAWAFRTLFNQPDAIALLRQDTDDRYWHRVLTYCAAENLQAVLDEYAHYLLDAEGLGARPPEGRLRGVAEKMAEALSIRPSQIDVEDLKIVKKTLKIDKFQMRGRFAMRLADYTDEEGAVARLGAVREAFNSPFKPFVLATTSVGQEGLDFHPYCYRVYHWNLPSNPVDLEQREGRVHRFKGHAVRLNLAECQASAIRGSGTAPDDPWRAMFEKAQSEEPDDVGLIPYWIYDKGSVRVERRVPMLPFSREETRLDWLKRSLAVYRLAFGQPRQDDLLDYLATLDVSGLSAEQLEELQIRLDPLEENGP